MQQQPERSRTILTVVGARPQFIKVAAVSRALEGLDGIREVLVHTGQHYDENMSEVFFRELGIRAPDHHLQVGSGGHGAQTGRMMEAIEKVVEDLRPDAMLVYGDTNSTLAGALVAAKLHVPLAHVEAGLRSHNRRMPEEINRVVSDHVADILFAPTEAAVSNLREEGIPVSKVHLAGDVMFDAAVFYRDAAERESRVLETRGLGSKGYVLATIHRAENTDDAGRLEMILEGLVKAARTLPVFFPLHPRVKKMITAHGLDRLLEGSGVILADPVGYLDMVRLERNTACIVTDSGGVQKEAFFHRVPCVTLRDETEWVELVDMGFNRLVPPACGAQVIADAVLGFRPEGWDRADLYGGGKASERVAAVMRDLLTLGARP